MNVATGVIENCSTTGTITGASNGAGGLVGATFSTQQINKCWTSATVKADSYAGGLVGLIDGYTTIKQCSSNAKIETGNYGGTIFGGIRNNNTVWIDDVTPLGTISGKNCGAVYGYVYNATVNMKHVSIHWSEGFGAYYGGSHTVNHYYTRALATGSNYGSRTACYAMQASDFTKKENFETYEFDEIWKMGDQYPILLQQIDIDDNADVKLNVGEKETLYIPDYFNLILPEDHNYNQKNRFTYSIIEGKKVNRTILENETTVEKEVDVANILGDKLSITDEAGIGAYTLTIKVHDTTDAYEDFNITFNIIAQQYVPVPQVETEALLFSRNTKLASLFLTEGWKWEDNSICPATGTHDYTAYYPFTEGAEYYDTSLLTADNVAFTEVTDTDTGKVIGIKVQVPVTTLESDETPHTKKFIITDADTDEPIENAEITTAYEDEFPYDHYTDANELTASLSQGNRDDITVSADYYKTFDDTVPLNGESYEAVPLSLEPTRYSFTAPYVYLKEKQENGSYTKTSTMLDGAQVTVTKADGIKAAAWNGGETSVTLDAGGTLDLPDGIFKIKNATHGYSSDEVTYLKIDRTAAEGERETYYESYTNAVLGAVKEDPSLYAAKLTEPTYDLDISKDSSDINNLGYTATLTLSNIKATVGTFGIRWDNEIFDLVTEGDYPRLSNVQWFTYPYALPTDTAYDENTEINNGYFVFTWQAPDDEEIDTEISSKQIATFKFKLKNRADADLITYDTFGIEPWDETVEAKAYAKEAARDGYDTRFWEYWRYYDADNNSPVKENRIEKSKAIINDIDTKGFFQASVNRDLAAAVPQDFVDVKTNINYLFDINNSVLKFHIYDSVTEDDLGKALVKLFDSANALKMYGSKETNYAGRASFAVNTKTAKETVFAYTTALDGYWPVPETGLTEDRPTVTAKTGRAVEVDVPLEQKIYHKPVLKKSADASTPDVLELVDEAQLGGQKYAYNGRDYHFRVKAARGYRITEYPTEAYVYVNDTLIFEDPITPDANRQFTISGSELTHALHPELAALDKATLDALALSNTDYADWTGSTQPNSDGYRGYNIDIRFDRFATEELEYIVEGVTNDGGYVTYAKDDGEDDCEITETDEKDPREYIMVQTRNSKNALGGPNHNTGTFTFTGNGDNIVERVFINGLEVDTYNDLHSFTYTFGEVDMDNNITVLFWDGVNPSDDKLMTLVVGEFGFADVIKPEAETDVMLTRRVYLNPTENLEFETHAMIGFELYKVEKESGSTEERSEINPVSSRTVEKVEDEHTYNIAYDKFSVSPPTDEEKNVTVYVTFKNPDAPMTPNLFVKSYVSYGKGTVDPAGILIYCKWDTVEIDLTADKPEDGTVWLVKSVMVSDYYDIDNAKEFEYDKPLADYKLYRWDTLEKDMAFGAVFMEKAFPVKGYVDLDQNTDNLTLGAPRSGAVVKFVRLDEQGNEIAKQPLFMTTSAELRKDALFEIELPAGKWNVYVTKQGYLTYKLTDFTMAEPALLDAEKGEYAVTLFGKNTSGAEPEVWHVVPYIGSTLVGKMITLTDAANVKSGWRAGVNDTVFNMADVTNNGEVNTDDMTFVMFNFNKRLVTQPYSDFAEKGSSSVVTYHTTE